MTLMYCKCEFCGNTQEFSANEALLGFQCMWKFGYHSPDLMCIECGFDHTLWKFQRIDWDDDPGEGGSVLPCPPQSFEDGS